MHRMTDREFESAVEEALANIPERFLEALENVAVVVEDEPDDYHFDILDEPTSCWACTTACPSPTAPTATTATCPT